MQIVYSYSAVKKKKQNQQNDCDKLQPCRPGSERGFFSSSAVDFGFWTMQLMHPGVMRGLRPRHLKIHTKAVNDMLKLNSVEEIEDTEEDSENEE